MIDKNFTMTTFAIFKNINIMFIGLFFFPLKVDKMPCVRSCFEYMFFAKYQKSNVCMRQNDI